MKAGRLFILGFLFLSATDLRAQVVVENPKKIAYPREQVLLSYEMARNHVLEEVFPHEKGSIPAFPVVLQLGCSDAENVTITNKRDSHSAVVCLREWDLEKFSYGLISIIQDHFIPEQKREELVQDIVHRVQLTAPVKVADIQNKR